MTKQAHQLYLPASFQDRPRRRQCPGHLASCENDYFSAGSAQVFQKRGPIYPGGVVSYIAGHRAASEDHSRPRVTKPAPHLCLSNAGFPLGSSLHFSARIAGTYFQSQ